MNEVLIRQATEADIFSIHQLQQEWFEENNTHGYMPDSPGQTMNRLGEYFLVAESDYHIVGFVAGSVRVSEDMSVIPTGSSYLEIDDLYVAISFRGQGLGSRLVEVLLAHAKAQGLGYATLYSAVKDIHEILRFYERHKFQSWYVQMFREL